MKKFALLLAFGLLLAAPSFAAPKQIIVLTQVSDGTNVTYSVLFWYPITANPVPQSNGSVWIPSGTSQGATAAENAAIQAGTVVEEQKPFQFAIGTNVTYIEGVLQQYWVKRNTQIAGQGGNQFYGAYFDGTTWGAQ